MICTYVRTYLGVDICSMTSESDPKSFSIIIMCYIIKESNVSFFFSYKGSSKRFRRLIMQQVSLTNNDKSKNQCLTNEEPDRDHQM